MSYDVPYNASVRKMTAAQLKKKMASEPEPEHYATPSVFKRMKKVPAKDRKYVLPDMSESQHVGGMCQSCMGGRDTSSGGGRDTSSGGRKMIGLAKPKKGDGFFGDLKRDLTHPKATLKGISKGKTWENALKKTGQIIENAVPFGAATVAGLSTGSPAAAIAGFKTSKAQIKEAKELAGSGSMDKRKARGQLVSKLMKQHGLSLAEASKMIKEKGLM